MSSSAEFNRVLRGGRRAERDGVVVYALPARLSAMEQGESARSRIGLVVRTPNRAVTRNRIKRRIRAAFVACAPPFGYDVVIRADERAEAMGVTDLTEALSRALCDCGVPSVDVGVPK